MILEGVNGPFGWVCPMIVGRDDLELDFFFRQKTFEGSWEFIVAYLEFGVESAGFQFVVYLTVGIDE